MLRHIHGGRFTTSRHLGKTSKFLGYDKTKWRVKGKQAQFACPALDSQSTRSAALRLDPGWQRDTLDKGRTRCRSPSKRPVPQSPSRKEKSDPLSTRRRVGLRRLFQE